MSVDCITPDAVSNFASKDTNRIVGKIAEVLALRSPYIDVLTGGTLPNVSDTVRSIVQERAVVASSLTKPVFTSDLEMCGVCSTPDRVGSTEYSYSLATLRGSGPRVCVKTSRTAFKGAYLQAQMSMEKAILQIMNSDVRATLLFRSGVKFVCNTGLSFDAALSGDAQQIDTQFVQVLPDAPISFKVLWRLGAFLREEMIADPFESNNGVMFKFIGGIEQIERFRNELDIKTELLAFVKGHYPVGDKNIDSYAFAGPYRGFGYGIDQQPLRCNGFDQNGDLDLIEPEIAVPATNGVAARRNPAWVTALYEVGFLVAADSFIRLTPENYTGEGTFKFAPQLSMGELKWHYIIDNQENKYGDYGQHIYQIQRAYQPVRPHAVIPILYKRCPYDTGLVTCDSSVNGL